jgi:hypothetical protein
MMNLINNSHYNFFFELSEFERDGFNWYHYYDPRLLVLLDVFRLQTGLCEISSHPKAMGRYDGLNNGKSGFDAHNFDKHGVVFGIDVFPFISGNEYTDAFNSYHIARRVGFTGIGIYPQWKDNGKRRFGMHLDTRRTNNPKTDPAVWGYVDGQFTSVENGLVKLREYE